MLTIFPDVGIISGVLNLICVMDYFVEAIQLLDNSELAGRLKKTPSGLV
jgi:hypothetical protein